MVAGRRHERQGGVHPRVPGCDQGVPGHRRRDPAPEDRRAARGHRGAAGDPARRDVRSGGRVGLRQDHARPDGRRTRDPDQRSGAVRRHRPRHGQGRRSSARCAATCSSCSRTPTPHSIRACGSRRSSPSRWTSPGVGTPKERTEKVRSLLDEVGLSYDVMDRYPHEFSGGQRQRLGLARALTLSPKVIIADEPVSALDVSIRSQILNLMKRLQASSRRDLHRDLPRPLGGQVPRRPDRRHVPRQARRARSGERHLRHGRPTPTPPACSTPFRCRTPSRQGQRSATVGVRGELPSPLYPPSGCRFRTRCPRAQDKCAEEVPLLRPFGTDHLAACHFPLQTPLNGNGAVQPVQATPAASSDPSMGLPTEPPPGSQPDPLSGSPPDPPTRFTAPGVAAIPAAAASGYSSPPSSSSSRYGDSRASSSPDLLHSLISR